MIEQIQVKDSDTFRDLGNQDSVLIWPSSQYVQEIQDLENILKEIELEMNEYVDKLTKE
jgi:excinuclease UvrABC helicase subunit UvrB